MRGGVFILCYHRVFEPAALTARGWPYRQRGTAVSTDVLAAQIEGLTTWFDVLPPCAAPGNLRASGGRPRCWITFDDGYRDTLEAARPILAAHGVTASAFVTTCTLDTPPTALPADRWYAALTNATRRRGILRVGDSDWRFDLDDANDRSRFVDGPERRLFMRSTAAQQAETLAALGEALGARTQPPEATYLSGDELRTLVGEGWAVGAHGATHAPFTTLDRAAVEAELRAVAATVRSVGVPQPSVFAWPDGAASSEGAAALTSHRYRMALALGDRVASDEDSMRVPRFLVPNSATWVEDVLLPLARRLDDDALG